MLAAFLVNLETVAPPVVPPVIRPGSVRPAGPIPSVILRPSLKAIATISADAEIVAPVILRVDLKAHTRISAGTDIFDEMALLLAFED